MITNDQKNAMPVTSPGIARGYTITYWSEVRCRNAERWATIASAAMATVASAPPTMAIVRLLRDRAAEDRVVEHRLEVLVVDSTLHGLDERREHRGERGEQQPAERDHDDDREVGGGQRRQRPPGAARASRWPPTSTCRRRVEAGDVAGEPVADEEQHGHRGEQHDGAGRHEALLRRAPRSSQLSYR